MATKRIITGLVIIIVIAVAVDAMLFATKRRIVTIPGQQPAQVSLVSQSTLAKLPVADDSKIDTSHVASGLTPPTNKWFSGLALEKTPEPVFPMPLSFAPTAGGFTLGLPALSVKANTIFGENNPAVTVAISGAKSYKVTRYDEVSVDLTYYDRSDKALGAVTIAEGSPYVFYKSMSNATLSATMNGATESSANIQAKIGNAIYHTVASNGATQSAKNGMVTQTVSSGALLTYYAIPVGQGDDLATNAGNAVNGTTVSYSTDGNKSKTHIHYETVNGKPTTISTLPHQSAAASTLTYTSIYGTMNVMANTNDLSFDVPAVTVKSQLDIGKLSTDQKSQIDAQLKIDAQKLNFQEDTYGGGKALYRAAQLLDIAEQLHDQTVATSLRNSLELELSIWYTPNNNPMTAKTFYHNTIIHGIVGSTASFGSEQFNDHHFHYGYFIYASSIVSKYDPAFMKKYEPMVNLLVADIANYKSGEGLPLRRMYDPYFSHSWASGSAPFADGNNQESSSEAINAWTAVSLWAGVTNNSSLADEAKWLLGGETASAQAYYLNSPNQSGYNHSIVSLNWGGKRDYATFFSDAPASMLAIQLIPMNPTGQGMPTSRIAAQLKEAVPTGNYNVSLGDYLIMYEGLIDKNKALQLAKTQSDQYIDTADSRTYLLAWLMTV